MARAHLCHDLCHNPPIPARVGSLLAVSLGYTQKAGNMPETRMNTASPCHFVSLQALPYQATRRFDTEEVAGSNPVVPTINYLKSSSSEDDLFILIFRWC